MSITASTPRRAALGTEPAEIVGNAKAYAALGVETLIVSANTSDPREAQTAMEMIAREVLASVSR